MNDKRLTEEEGEEESLSKLLQKESMLRWRKFRSWYKGGRIFETIEKSVDRQRAKTRPTSEAYVEELQTIRREWRTHFLRKRIALVENVLLIVKELVENYDLQKELEDEASDDDDDDEDKPYRIIPRSVLMAKAKVETLKNIADIADPPIDLDSKCDRPDIIIIAGVSIFRPIDHSIYETPIPIVKPPPGVPEGAPPPPEFDDFDSETDSDSEDEDEDEYFDDSIEYEGEEGDNVRATKKTKKAKKQGFVDPVCPGISRFRDQPKDIATLELRLSLLLPKTLALLIQEGMDIPEIEDAASCIFNRKEKWNNFVDFYTHEENHFEENWYKQILEKMEDEKNGIEGKEYPPVSITSKIRCFTMELEINSAVKDDKIRRAINFVPKDSDTNEKMLTKFRKKYLKNHSVRRDFLGSEINAILVHRRANILLPMIYAKQPAPIIAFSNAPTILGQTPPERPHRILFFPTFDPELYSWSDVKGWYTESELNQDDDELLQSEKDTQLGYLRDAEAEKERLNRVAMLWEDRRGSLMKRAIAYLNSLDDLNESINPRRRSYAHFPKFYAEALKEDGEGEWEKFDAGTGIDNTDELDDERLEEELRAREEAKRREELRRTKAEEAKKKAEEDARRREEEALRRRVEETKDLRESIIAHLANIKRQRQIAAEEARARAKAEADARKLQEEEERQAAARNRAIRLQEERRDFERVALEKQQKLVIERVREARELSQMRVEDTLSAQYARDLEARFLERQMQRRFLKSLYLPFEGAIQDELVDPILWDGPVRFKPKKGEQEVFDPDWPFPDRYCLPYNDFILEEPIQGPCHCVLKQPTAIKKMEDLLDLPERSLGSHRSNSTPSSTSIKRDIELDTDEIISVIRDTRTADPIYYNNPPFFSDSVLSARSDTRSELSTQKSAKLQSKSKNPLSVQISATSHSTDSKSRLDKLADESFKQSLNSPMEDLRSIHTSDTVRMKNSFEVRKPINSNMKNIFENVNLYREKRPTGNQEADQIGTTTQPGNSRGRNENSEKTIRQITREEIDCALQEKSITTQLSARNPGFEGSVNLCLQKFEFDYSQSKGLPYSLHSKINLSAAIPLSPAKLNSPTRCGTGTTFCSSGPETRGSLPRTASSNAFRRRSFGNREFSNNANNPLPYQYGTSLGVKGKKKEFSSLKINRRSQLPPVTTNDTETLR